ncbi:MAG: hypothetical protein Q8K72_06535, partial [Acidimicrobiales bacterium]|nr:hypothetical protein [Acidimicrobiales bacterium]
PDVPDVPITIPSLPDLNLPTLPALAPMLVIPGVDALPIDPAALAASAHQAIGQVAALLPSPAALQAAVLDCVSDVAALVPAPGPTMSGSPLGFLTGLLGGLTAASTPSVPDPAAVQAAITSCVANVMGVLPDPTALASALTAAFGPSLSVPIADVIGQLTGSLPAAPDAGQLLDLVTALVGATGSPTELIGQLTGALDGVVPAPLDQLISLPLTVLHQLFTTVGRA